MHTLSSLAPECVLAVTACLLKEEGTPHRDGAGHFEPAKLCGQAYLVFFGIDSVTVASEDDFVTGLFIGGGGLLAVND